MDNSVFNPYAPIFGAITPLCVSEVYQAASSELSGSVLDAGCGPCKLAPYLVDQPEFLRYMGVDYSREMVTLARQLLDQLDSRRFQVQCDKVENTHGEFDCVVSLQSYYAWPNPVKALTRLHQVLVPEGKLVLASANDRLDISKLLDEASRDWLLNPLWPEYRQHNQQIAANASGHFPSLDSLIGELRCVGFEIADAHTRFYDGGLNYVVATR